MLAAYVAIGGALADYRLNSPQPANVRLAAGGVVRAWLVAGPFPNAPDYEGKTYGMATQWIGAEANARPVEGKYITHLRDPGIPEFWRLSTTGWDDALNFDTMLNGAKPGVAYAYTTLVANRAGAVTLLLQGVESVRVILNGKKVYEGSDYVALSARIAARLQKGPNRLLIKVAHARGNWSLKLRLAQPGVYEQLDVYRTGAHAEPPALRSIRAVREKPGALDLDAALAYDSAARTAIRWLEVFEGDIPHPRALRTVIGEAARGMIGAQARDAGSVSTALRRGTNMILLALHQAREQAVAHFKNPGPLLKTKPPREEYIYAGRRYFVGANGKRFMPIGLRLNPESPQSLSCYPALSEYDPEVADTYFGKAAESGVTVVAVNVQADPGVTTLEPREDRESEFDSPEHIKWVDTLLLIAVKHHLKLLLGVWDQPSGMGRRRAPRGVDELRRDWREAIDRWGNSGAVFGWDVYPPPAAPKRPSVEGELADFIRKYEKRRWGRNHPIAAAPNSGSRASGRPFDFDESVLWWDYRAPQQRAIEALTPQLGAAGIPRLAVLNSAWDLAENPSTPGWLALVHGGAGVLFQDIETIPEAAQDAVLAAELSLREFALHVDWAGLEKGNAFSPSPPTRWAAAGFGSGKTAIVWAGGPTLGERVVLDAKAPIRSGRYKAYDCSAGKWIGEGSFKGSLTIPNGLKAVAWVLTSP